MKQSILISSLIISILFLMSSCLQGTPEEKEIPSSIASEKLAPESSKELLEVVEVVEKTIPYKWVLISGVMGLYQSTVMIDLKISNGNVTGKYFYARHQKYLDLNGTVGKDGMIKLKESYKGKTTGFLNFTNIDGKIKGSWCAKEDFKDPQEFNGNEITTINDSDYAPKFERFAYEHTTVIYNGEDVEPDEIAVTDDLMVNYISPDLITFYYHVTGANGHIGSIEGLASKSKDGIWIFKGEDECILTLKIDAKKAYIDEDNCNYYRGFRAYFENTLDRVK